LENAINKIMIVEDDESVGELLHTIFAGVIGKYQVVYVKDGEEALKLARIVVPDIILLDINLPGLNGYDVCRQVKTDPNMSQTKIIMVTGMAQNSDWAKSKEAGADDYFTKPFRATALVERVETLLNK